MAIGGLSAPEVRYLQEPAGPEFGGNDYLAEVPDYMADLPFFTLGFPPTTFSPAPYLSSSQTPPMHSSSNSTIPLNTPIAHTRLGPSVNENNSPPTSPPPKENWPFRPTTENLVYQGRLNLLAQQGQVGLAR